MERPTWQADVLCHPPEIADQCAASVFQNPRLTCVLEETVGRQHEWSRERRNEWNWNSGTTPEKRLSLLALSKDVMVADADDPGLRVSHACTLDQFLGEHGKHTRGLPADRRSDFRVAFG